MIAEVSGGFLVCKKCGRRQPAGEISVDRVWPKHCGQTMELASAGPAPDDVADFD